MVHSHTNDSSHDQYALEEAYNLELIASRLRGETARFDITTKKGEIIVEEGARITARHIREMEKGGLTHLPCPSDYVCGHVLAEDIVDTETGEILIPCNSTITEEILDKLAEAGVTEFKTIYTNDLDCGPFISDTLNVDPTTNRHGLRKHLKPIKFGVVQ